MVHGRQIFVSKNPVCLMSLVGLQDFPCFRIQAIHQDICHVAATAVRPGASSYKNFLGPVQPLRTDHVWFTVGNVVPRPPIFWCNPLRDWCLMLSPKDVLPGFLCYVFQFRQAILVHFIYLNMPRPEFAALTPCD